MSRTLVAGTRAPRTKRPPREEQELLDRFHGVMVDLSMTASKIRALTEANARLEAKLNDPALMDHPKRAEHVARFHERELQIRVLHRHHADWYRREFAVIWQQLPEERREHIRTTETGWPQQTSPALLARRVWDWVQSDEFWWPGTTECPF